MLDPIRTFKNGQYMDSHFVHGHFRGEGISTAQSNDNARRLIRVHHGQGRFSTESDSFFIDGKGTRTDSCRTNNAGNHHESGDKKSYRFQEM